MKKELLIGIVSCLLAIGMQAETVRVMRFVAVDGAEQEVAMGSLQKVVFTADSMLLISAKGEETTPMYKYDYRAIVFDESSAEEGIEEVRSETANAVRGEKFIKDGRICIRLDDRVYTILGNEL